jgi:hypothetical protein
VSDDLLDHRPLQDGGNDLELPAAAVRAVLHVDVKDSLEQPRPADASRPSLRSLGHTRTTANRAAPGEKMTGWWLQARVQYTTLNVSAALSADSWRAI